jgi:hypothetical protein
MQPVQLPVVLAQAEQPVGQPSQPLFSLILNPVLQS